MWRYKTCEKCGGTGKDVDHQATGQNVREYRQEKGASLRQVAFICNWSATYLSDLERGNRNWNEEKLHRVINAIESF